MQKTIPKNIPAGALVIRVNYGAFSKKLTAPVVLRQED